jgi:hypothetical protein
MLAKAAYNQKNECKVILVLTTNSVNINRDSDPLIMSEVKP